MAILFAIIALTGWAVGDIFLTKVSRRIGEGLAAFWWFIGNLCISLLYLPFAPPLLDVKMLGIAMLLGFFANSAMLLYIRALTIGNASLAGTIAGAFPLVTVPLSILLFGERLIPIQFLGIVVILAGLTLSTLKKEGIREIQSGRIFSDPGAGLALISMVMWGIYWAVIRIPIESIGWYWSGIAGSLFFIFLPFIGVVKGNLLRVFTKPKAIPLILIASFFIQSASFSFNIGITYGYSSLVAPVAGASPVLFVILSHFVFRDKLSTQQKIGIFTALAGILLIAFSSGS